MTTQSKKILVKDMGTSELAQMFEEIGLDKYKNSILFQRLDGSTLLGFDEVDLQEKLGMMDQSEQNHLMLNMNIRSRDQYVSWSNFRWSDPVIHGWGANLSQELGIRTGTTVVRIP